MAAESSQPSRRTLFAVLAAWLAWLLGPRPAPAAPALQFVVNVQPTLTYSAYLGGTGFTADEATTRACGPSNPGAGGALTCGAITYTEINPNTRRTRTRTYDKDGRLVSDETRSW